MHMNSTRTYNLDGTLHNSTTVYQYMTAKQLKLSVVLSQKAIIAGTTTINKDDSGSSGDNDNSTDVTHTAVNTPASDRERAFGTDYAVTPQYNLSNQTKHSSQPTYATYTVNTRTVNIAG